MRLTRTELAKRRGISKQGMGQLLKRYDIKAGPDGKFDSEIVDLMLSGDANGDGMTLSEAVRRKEAALAGLRELELAQASGDLVSVQWVIDTETKMNAAIKNKILQIPSELARVMPSHVRRLVKATAEKIVRQACEDLVTVVRNNAGEAETATPRSIQ